MRGFLWCARVQLDKECGDYLNPSSACTALFNKMSDAVGDVNVYDIYTPCINGGAEQAVQPRRRIPNAAAHAGLTGPDGCIDGIAAAKVCFVSHVSCWQYA